MKNRQNAHGFGATSFERRVFRGPVPLCLAFFLSWVGTQVGVLAAPGRPGFKETALPVPNSGRTGFSLVPADSCGIPFSNKLPVSISMTNQVLLDGSGVAAGDVDGDGRCDLYFCAIDGRNTLYRNLGNWRFENITEQAGVAYPGMRSTGAAFADLDGDGDLDLIVATAGNGTPVYYNDGKGRFTRAPGILNQGKGAKTITLADVDGDGFLDVYIANYRLATVMDMADARVTFKMVDGRQTVATFDGRPTTDPDLVDRFVVGPLGEFQENGEPDVLYRNIGGTNLTPIPFTGGNFLDEDGQPLTKPPVDWGLTAMFRDATGDGLPDLYICNDFQTPDRFWINQGGGKFRLAPRLALRHTSVSSMCVDFADINRDGLDDFVVVDMMSRRHADRMHFMFSNYALNYPPGYFEDRPQYELNTLFLNQGDNTYAEIGQLGGVEASEWSWSCIFLDVDLDGWEDLLVASGMERDGRDLDVAEELKALRAKRQPSKREILQARLMYPRHADGNLAFRNRRDLTFEETSDAWGFNAKGICSSMALADLDNDGDLDVVVNGLNGPVLLYRNESIAPRVAVRLEGLGPNTRGIGARITVSGGSLPVQSQEMICGGRYVSGDDTLRVFAAGADRAPMTLEVAWRGGRRSVLTNVLANHLYQIDEAAAPATPPETKRGNQDLAATPRSQTEGTAVRPWFEDASALLSPTHHEERFNDYVRQPLLPNRLSQLGPGVAWFDVDDDGRDDLVLGCGSGGRLGIWLNRPGGPFQQLNEPAFSKPAPRDLTSVLGWRPSPKEICLLAGTSNYEDGEPGGPAVLQYHLTAKRVDESVGAEAASTGPLALGPLKGDGRLALFIGGRVVPGRYPEPANSRIYQFDGARWQLDEENSRPLTQAGLVTGAIFSDLTGDGYPELILAREWGSIRVFRNERGRLKEWDIPLQAATVTNQSPSALSHLKGWWNSVTAGDFDGDGRLDLAVGNWGRNTKYEAHRARPLVVYYGDFNADNTVQLVETYYDPELAKTVPARQLNALARGMPWLRQRFTTHREYSLASIEQVLGDRLATAKTLEANWLESTVFLNRGDHFEPRVLPVEAQMAPVFGLCAGDLDGDGNEDLFLAQNFFDCHSETARYDAGRGLVLRGNGKGQFRPLSARESGIAVYGQQRGAALSDFDGDGRPDLAVTQNGAATRLFHNVGAKPGLRVRLKGAPDNPQAFGTILRLEQGGKGGSMREFRGGGGYWSQDGVVQPVAIPARPGRLHVLWPGGKTDVVEVPAGAREMVVEYGRSR
jgi:hypothetical protein